jgi:ribokinase
MILIYGTILMKTQCVLGKTPAAKGVHFTDSYAIDIGGKGAIQSVAAVKASTSPNTKVALIGQTGDDYYGKNIRLRLRQNGVVTSALARHETAPTGSVVEIGQNAGQKIIALGASAATNHEQVPMEIISEKSVILLQDEFPAAQNLPLIEKAKEGGATIILNASERADIADYDINQIDYIITNTGASKTIEHIKSAAPQKLIVLTEQGTLITHNGQTPAPALENIEWVDPTCSDDAFCGTFTVSLAEGRELEDVLHRAQIARTLTASKKGGRETLPYPDEIKDALKEIATL